MDEETQKEKKKKTCFVIMPISDVDGYDKGHFTRVYEYIIKPACNNAGFEPIRADDTSKTNVIIVDILKQILDADMAICDISSRNANVFYELGFRQAFNKKTVLIRDNKTAMPFDVSSIRTLSYNANLRIDEVKNSISRIEKALKETALTGDDEFNSLISILSIGKAVLPDNHKMTSDTMLILNEIDKLNYKLNRLKFSLNDNVEKLNRPLKDESQNSLGYREGDFIFFHGNRELKFGRIVSCLSEDLFQIVTDDNKFYITTKNMLSKA